MALADDTRGKREYDKFVEDVSGNTGMRVVTTSNETLEASGTATISASSTPGAVVLAATNVTGKQRIGLQFINGGSVDATFKVFGSLIDSPGTYATNKWTQIGDDISCTASAITAYKAIATTPVKFLLVHAFVASSSAALTVHLMAD